LEFSPPAQLKDDVPLVRLEDDLRLANFAHGPPRVHPKLPKDREGTATEVTVPGIAIGTDLDAFRRKARMFLKPYENHIADSSLSVTTP
jgi:hypothetical protein